MENEKTGYFVPISPDHELRKDASLQANHQVTRPQHHSFVERMRRSLAAPWLSAILFACFFLGIFGRSLPWTDSEFVMQNPMKSQEALQDIVSWSGLVDEKC
jgi:hypothetical protein